MTRIVKMIAREERVTRTLAVTVTESNDGETPLQTQTSNGLNTNTNKLDQMKKAIAEKHYSV